MSASRAAAAARRAAVGTASLIVFAGAGTGTALADDNGMADKSAQAIAEASRTAMSKVTSMRMVAKVSEGAGTTALDIRFDDAGDCVGTVTPPGGSGKADVVKRGNDVWMKLDDDLLRAQVPAEAAEDAIALINGRYLHGTTDNIMLRDFAQFCDLDYFKSEFSSKPANEQLTKGARTTVDGRPAITVTGKRGGDTGSYQVSTQDEPYLLRVQGTKASGERVEATFSAFDEPVRPEPPAAADSVELSKLQ
ncbi:MULTISPECIES: hypothetical protein [unclassified Streptomyces]|uniref:hypothetical protein n=1 Tax=unclassified Streptomyces TaxID=2593676 RepID=UPI00044D8510|nr:hypothetical protein [Streptomyces sp. PCS3-D2]WKV70735.1 hypothetical protein AW27_003890 [Streptomyces sp. PCS3-D2]